MFTIFSNNRKNTPNIAENITKIKTEIDKIKEGWKIGIIVGETVFCSSDETHYNTWVRKTGIDFAEYLIENKIV
jgi:hypothetical protein